MKVHINMVENNLPEFIDCLHIHTDANSVNKFSWPQISVVMPSFNQVRFIERSILSVINQNYPNLQFIIIDGGSSDGTIEIIEKYEKYISYWISEPDKGQSDALNKGFAQANGDIYAWLNSDDLYLPKSLELIATVFIENPNKRIVYGDWLLIDENDKAIDYYYAFNFTIKHLIYEGFPLNAQSMFWRSSVHRHFEGFLECLYNTMDYQMMIAFAKIVNKEEFFRISKPLACFRRHPEQKTQNMNERVFREHQFLANHYGYLDKYQWQGKLKRLYYRLRRAYWYYRRGGLNYLYHKTSHRE